MSVARKALRFPKSLLEPMRHVLESRDLGISVDDMLNHLGVDRTRFDDPAFSLDADTFITLHQWLRERTRGRIRLKDWLSAYSATSLGFVGLAALSSLSARDALEVGIRYAPLLVPGMKVELVEGPRTSRLVLTLDVDFGELNRPLLEFSVGIINIISRDTMGEDIPRTIHFRHACGVDRDGHSRLKDYQEAYGCEVVFNSDFDGLTSDSRYLALKTRRPNGATSQLARSLLDSEMQARMATQTFAAFVHGELLQMARAGKFPTLEAFADSVHHSPRNLTRKLAKEATSFKQLANDVWYTLARELLASSTLSVEQIAHRTGFNSGNAFSRAFKSLSGDTPLQWRRAQAATPLPPTSHPA
ncbi:MAG: AraC family transcriptional regulator ligand-binding domain-containing protein [Moraxellaceae bacterium]|nr:AraC family transcriptional regulator ligand-binding domain-containing protein [Moraxellaceae bacterium]